MSDVITKAIDANSVRQGSAITATRATMRGAYSYVNRMNIPQMDQVAMSGVELFLQDRFSASGVQNWTHIIS